LYDYTAQDLDELSFKEGDVIEVWRNVSIFMSYIWAYARFLVYAKIREFTCCTEFVRQFFFSLLCQ
jgi:hypothetical protein